MRNFFLTKPKTTAQISSCYFFHGEEVFFAQEYIDSIKQLLSNRKDGEINLEKFRWDEDSWVDIIDTARTAPLLFMQSRIIVVEYPKSKSSAPSSKKRTLSNTEKKLIQDYLEDPSPETTLVVIFPDKAKKDNSLVKFFSGFSSGDVCVAEMRSLWENELDEWLDRKAASEGKRISYEAKRRLMELIGNAPSLLAQELEKIFIYIGEKKTAEVEDVEEVTMALKTYTEYAISDSLTQADFAASVKILDELINKESIPPTKIMGNITKFFRDILMAKLGLEQKNPDRKAIFRELNPNISERFQKLYDRKFRALFSLSASLDWNRLSYILSELREIDLKMKTTGESPQILLEGFLFNCCRMLKELQKDII
ncbi:MAG: DNA polymerase III subunit delta [Candidatus Aminicenantes bacterium]|nr:DNA polymerase III subunit delta [Candidatus Aminicenantes bacterium]